MTTRPSSGWRQSLADGAPGILLQHIERARTEAGSWEAVKQLARAMTHKPVQANPDVADLFYGAPAVAYALHSTGQPVYEPALCILDQSIAVLVRHRLSAAHRLIDQGGLARAGDYDLIHGLTGLGAYLLHRDRDPDLLRHVLDYLVRLTEPVQCGHEELPGWWANGSPDRRQSPRWDGGHAGFGMAHGISGPLALLSTSMRRGVIVNGQVPAIDRIRAWLKRWCSGGYAWWPDVIDRAELRAGNVKNPGPRRPSWCYGTPGIAWAMHAAEQALDDQSQPPIGQQALIDCLTDDLQLAQITDPGLCHGWAGLIHTSRRMYAASGDRELGHAIETVHSRLEDHPNSNGPPADEGLLEGRTGVDLAKADHGARPRWDACLLIG